MGHSIWKFLLLQFQKHWFYSLNTSVLNHLSRPLNDWHAYVANGLGWFRFIQSNRIEPNLQLSTWTSFCFNFDAVCFGAACQFHKLNAHWNAVNGARDSLMLCMCVYDVNRLNGLDAVKFSINECPKCCSMAFVVAVSASCASVTLY